MVTLFWVGTSGSTPGAEPLPLKLKAFEHLALKGDGRFVHIVIMSGDRDFKFGR